MRHYKGFSFADWVTKAYLLYRHCAQWTPFPSKPFSPLFHIPKPGLLGPSHWAVSPILWCTLANGRQQWETAGRRTGYVFCCPCFLPMSCVGHSAGSGCHLEAHIQWGVSFLVVPSQIASNWKANNNRDWFSPSSGRSEVQNQNVSSACSLWWL